MRCRACNCVLESDDDPELCQTCLNAINAELRAPIPMKDSDLVDQFEHDYRRDEDITDA